MGASKYFSYQIPNTGSFFIGTEKSQIINTLLYYKNERGESNLEIPSLGKIEDLEELCIQAAFPLLHVKHFISAEVRKNVTFEVNANAYEHMKQLARSYKALKRGDLFKFQTLPILGLWFLPEDIMQGIKEYDWKQHEKQMKVWVEDREEGLNDMERKGMLLRARRPATSPN